MIGLKASIRCRIRSNREQVEYAAERLRNYEYSGYKFLWCEEYRREVRNNIIAVLRACSSNSSSKRDARGHGAKRRKEIALAN